ncbi:MAG: hypothetical protein ABI824_13700 [Acidobacteriota bacterium]
MPLSFMSLRHLQVSRCLALGAIVGGLLGVPASAQAPNLLKDTPLLSSEAPPEVVSALRTRVTEFFQLCQDKSFRKTLAYVADDTQDEWFAGGKMDIQKFGITDIHFAPGFTKATVLLDVARTMVVQVDKYVVSLPMSTTWKVEDGQWMWYHDASLDQKTPMTGLMAVPTNLPKNDAPMIHQDADGTVKLPDNFADPNVIAAAGQAILSKGGLDKSTAKLSLTGPSEDRVVFHNSQPGFIDLELAGIPQIPGLTITMDKKQLGPNENSVVRFSYNPPAKSADGSPVQAPFAFDAKVVMQPFERVLPVRVTFEQ